MALKAPLKGRLFADTPGGAKASELYYTHIEAAKANDIDPLKYILHLFTHIANVQTAEEIKTLLKWNVKNKLVQTNSAEP